jgi:hypothetical protein
VRNLAARAAISLAIPNSRGLVARVAAWLTDFFELTLQDEEVASRLHMAAYELIENVLKYGDRPELDLELELVRSADAATLRLKAHNTTSPERLEEVVRRLEELRAAKDPVAYYDRLVRESAPMSGCSGLGLARIRAEGYLGIDFKVEGQRLSIEVETTVKDNA